MYVEYSKNTYPLIILHPAYHWYGTKTYLNPSVYCPPRLNVLLFPTIIMVFTHVGKTDWDEIRISPEISTKLLAMVTYAEENWDNLIKRLFNYKSFYDHILEHFEDDHPDWEVCCKICNKTYGELLKEVD